MQRRHTQHCRLWMLFTLTMFNALRSWAGLCSDRVPKPHQSLPFWCTAECAPKQKMPIIPQTKAWGQVWIVHCMRLLANTKTSQIRRRHKKRKLEDSEDSSIKCLYISEVRWNVLTEGQQHGACLFSHSLIGTSIATQRWQALLRCLTTLCLWFDWYNVRITKKLPPNGKRMTWNNLWVKLTESRNKFMNEELRKAITSHPCETASSSASAWCCWFHFRKWREKEKDYGRHQPAPCLGQIPQIQGFLTLVSPEERTLVMEKQKIKRTYQHAYMFHTDNIIPLISSFSFICQHSN